jgi:hypothetical protein
MEEFGFWLGSVRSARKQAPGAVHDQLGRGTDRESGADVARIMGAARDLGERDAAGRGLTGSACSGYSRTNARATEAAPALWPEGKLVSSFD